MPSLVGSEVCIRDREKTDKQQRSSRETEEKQQRNNRETAEKQQRNSRDTAEKQQMSDIHSVCVTHTRQQRVYTCEIVGSVGCVKGTGSGWTGAARPPSPPSLSDLAESRPSRFKDPSA